MKKNITQSVNTMQTSIFLPSSCVFTGHRNIDENFKKKKLKRVIENFIKEDIRVFYCGMACGFDLIACEIVIHLKKKYKDVQIFACIPCLNQERTFPANEKEKYKKLIEKVDKKIYVSEESYFVGCMHKRNRFMCDKADCMIAYCNQEKGGTAYTVKYFQNSYPNKKILFL